MTNRNELGNSCAAVSVGAGTGDFPNSWTGIRGTSTQVACTRVTLASPWERTTGARITNATTTQALALRTPSAIMGQDMGGRTVTVTIQASCSVAVAQRLEIVTVGPTGTGIAVLAQSTNISRTAGQVYRLGLSATIPSGAGVYGVYGRVVTNATVASTATLTGTACRIDYDVADVNLPYADGATSGWAYENPLLATSAGTSRSGVPVAIDSTRAWRLFDTYTNGATYSDATGRTQGMEFEVTSECYASQIWVFRPNSNVTVPTSASLWDVTTGTELTAVNNSTAPVGWSSVAIPYPVKLAVGKRYRVANTFPGSGTTVLPGQSNYWLSGGGASGRLNGPLSAPSSANATNGHQGPYLVSATKGFPNTSSTSKANYGADITVAMAVGQVLPPIEWKMDYTQNDVVAGGAQNSGSQRQIGTPGPTSDAQGYNDTTVPWPIPMLPASAGRPGKMIALTIPDNYVRYEFRPNHRDIGPNETHFFGVAVRMPPGFPVDAGAFQLFEQIHQGWGNYSPPIAFELSAGKLRLTGGYGLSRHPDLGGNESTDPMIYAHDQVLVNNPAIGPWHGLVYSVGPFSTQPNTSKITVWWNGVKVLDNWTLPCPTLVDGESYRKCGIYHSKVLPGLTIEETAHATSATYAGADPSATISGLLSDKTASFEADDELTNWPQSYQTDNRAPFYRAFGRGRIQSFNAGNGTTTYTGRKTADQPAGALALTQFWLEASWMPQADPGGNPSPGMAWVMSASEPQGTRIGFEYDPRYNTLTLGQQIGYGDGGSTVLTYDGYWHRWWLLRLVARTTGYTLTWETSPTGLPNSWTVRRTMTPPAWVLNRDLSASIESYRSTGPSDYFEIDNVNLVPAAGPRPGSMMVSAF